MEKSRIAFISKKQPKQLTRIKKQPLVISIGNFQKVRINIDFRNDNDQFSVGKSCITIYDYKDKITKDKLKKTIVDAIKKRFRNG